MNMTKNPNELEREIQNRWADGYDAIFFDRPGSVGNLRDFRQSMEGWIMKHFAHVPPAERRNLRILEVGCGTGELLSQLRADGFTNLYGLDLSDKMIERASQKCPGLSFTMGPFDSAVMPIPQFDLIIGTEWLHHILDLKPVFQRAYDLLAPGGLFCGMEPSQDWLFERVGLRQSVMTLVFAPLVHIMAFKNRKKIQALIELEGDRGYTSWHRHLSVRELLSASNDLPFKIEIERRHTLIPFFSGALFNTASDMFLYRFLRCLDRNVVDRMGRGGYLFLCAVKPSF